MSRLWSHLKNFAKWDMYLQILFIIAMVIVGVVAYLIRE